MQVAEQWAAAWPDALAAWSRYTKLRPPRFCLDADEAAAAGLTDAFAAIRLHDQAIIVSLPEVLSKGVEAFGLEILAHEIGHHVLAPANLSDHARTISRVRWGLPTVEHHAPMVANLYTDLLINDRLERAAGLRLDQVFRALKPKKKMGDLWAVYLRIYELLWRLETGTLGRRKLKDHMEGDAWLGSRLIRSYRKDWLDGAGRFAALVMPYLLSDDSAAQSMASMADTQGAGAGGVPNGLTQMDPDEQSGAIHPSEDPELTGDSGGDGQGGGEGDGESNDGLYETSQQGGSKGQTRQPFEFGEILRAAGVNLTNHEVAVRYYREQAQPHLVPFPRRLRPSGSDPLPEGLEPWDIGQSLDAVDWLQSVLVSPAVIPGMTTVQRVWGTTEGSAPGKEPYDLDIYVDSSGSMANPQVSISFPALAGAIICLSALRAGATVQATLWSGKQQVTTTDGFVRDGEQILRVLTGFYGGGTAFPLPTLRRTYEQRRQDERPVHIMVISDSGIDTMFLDDERGNSGWDVARRALEVAGGGGSFVLNLPASWEDMRKYAAFDTIAKARDDQGWQVHAVTGWQELVDFARDFSRMAYDLSRDEVAA